MLIPAEDAGASICQANVPGVYTMYPPSLDKTKSPNSAKKFQTFSENFTRLHGEIERFLYAAERHDYDQFGTPYQFN